jgi:hypothetical protein
LPKKETETWIVQHDLHFPLYHKPTWNAVMDFVSKNELAGFCFAGDQFDNLEISHHTKGKPIFRETGAYEKNTRDFDNLILKPLEKKIADAKRIYIIGNHERFEQDLVESHPELQGSVEHEKLLNLVERGWKIVPLGHAYKIGKLAVIHGEVLTGIGNQAGMYPSKKAVEVYAGNVLAGHTHSPQSFTRISPVDSADTWMGWIAPVACETNPAYLRNRPKAWLNGTTVIEVRPDGNFNLFPVIIDSKGRFSYGGKVYGAK